eukprot:TRINITY_DN1062_c0_g4_i1.p1 TRINITY_DN1062_c0_g4~~TRINITY_DN1062_c0_g4_i1.p1  ORF type:complete len:152 (+),score=22.90 TRINITY_DN1062_c0_g4_i1:283-738(+)
MDVSEAKIVSRGIWVYENTATVSEYVKEKRETVEKQLEKILSSDSVLYVGFDNYGEFIFVAFRRTRSFCWSALRQKKDKKDLYPWLKGGQHGKFFLLTLRNLIEETDEIYHRVTNRIREWCMSNPCCMHFETVEDEDVCVLASSIINRMVK